MHLPIVERVARCRSHWWLTALSDRADRPRLAYCVRRGTTSGCCDLGIYVYCLEEFFMKPIVWAGFVALAGLSGIANAACTDPIVPAAGDRGVVTLSSLFSNKLVCGKPGAANVGAAASDRWQERHASAGAAIPGGSLVDYKKGPSDPVDPSKTVGSWSIDTATNQIVHSYTGGSTFKWTVHKAGDRYSFCNASGEQVVALIPPGMGTSGCGGVYP